MTIFKVLFVLVGGGLGVWPALLLFGVAWACLVGGQLWLAAYRLPRWILMQTGDGRG